MCSSGVDQKVAAAYLPRQRNRILASSPRPAAVHDGRRNGGFCRWGSSCFAAGSSGASVMGKRTDVSPDRYTGDSRSAYAELCRRPGSRSGGVGASANQLALASLRVTSVVPASISLAIAVIETVASASLRVCRRW